MDDPMSNQEREADIELQELESLLLEAEDGALDEVGRGRIRAILKSSTNARARYVDLQMLSAAMQLEGSVGIDFEHDLMLSNLKSADSHVADTRNETTTSRGVVGLAQKLHIRTILMIAASFLGLALIGRWWVLESRLSQVNLESDVSKIVVIDDSQLGEATSQGVAVVSRLVDASWVRAEDEFVVGDSLEPGELILDSGLVQIEFFCGATIVLEGPAELEMKSATEVRFRRGRLRANVPPAARGFQVLVDEMTVVDLGTEFGISVTPERADVHVFDGEVELHRPLYEMRLLTAGESVSRFANGDLDPAKLPDEEFVDIKELDEQADDQTTRRWKQWKDFSERMRRDDRMIAYYAMGNENSWNRRLPCSNVPTNPDLDGAIVGAVRVAGRWPEKSAIEFKRPGDRVRVSIPGEYGSLTLACWVKIDSLDRWFNSLFLTDNYQRGEPHWQILDTGQLFFSVRVSDEDHDQEHREIYSPPFWKPSMSGQWLHLATTYDVEKQCTTHFLNGEVLSREIVPDYQMVTPTRIGKASIGNWSLPTKPDAKFAVRNLNGSIDEFALFGAALSEAEIREMYENGKP